MILANNLMISLVAKEMASISAFMAGSQRQYPSHYMETSISTYVDACRQHQFATRATLFGVEAFKSQGMYSEAAFALLKMTGEVRQPCIAALGVTIEFIKA